MEKKKRKEKFLAGYPLLGGGPFGPGPGQVLPWGFLLFAQKAPFGFWGVGGGRDALAPWPVRCLPP